MKCRYLVLIAMFSFLVFGCEGNPEQEKQNLILDKEDVKLVSAKREAFQSFESFASFFKKHQSDTSYFFSIKTEFKDGNRYEHMWVEVSEIDDSNIYGILGNEPGIIKTMRLGDTLKIPRSEIEDWMIHDKKRDTILGAFTVRALGREDLLH